MNLYIHQCNSLLTRTFCVLHSVYMHLYNFRYTNIPPLDALFNIPYSIVIITAQRLLYYGAKQRCFLVEKKSLLCFSFLSVTNKESLRVLLVN